METRTRDFLALLAGQCSSCHRPRSCRSDILRAPLVLSVPQHCQSRIKSTFVFILFIIFSSRHMNHQCLGHGNLFSHTPWDRRLFTEHAHSGIHDTTRLCKKHLTLLFHKLLRNYSVFLAYYHSMGIFFPSNLNILQHLQLNPTFVTLE